MRCCVFGVWRWQNRRGKEGMHDVGRRRRSGVLMMSALFLSASYLTPRPWLKRAGPSSEIEA